MRFFVPLLFAIPLIASAGELGYIQSAKAKLLAQPQFNGQVVAEVSRGARVDLLETDGRWCKVRFDGKTGWVSKFLIAEQPPINKVSVLHAGDAENLNDNARRRASAVTTAGAARGLASEERQRLGHGPAVNYEAVDRLDRFQFDEQEVARFVQEGVAR